MKLAIFGATGRMGRAICRLAHEAGDIQIVGAIAAPNDPHLGRDAGELAGVGTLGVEVSADVASGLLGADVVIDFSTAAAVPEFFAVCEKKKVPVVSGTTNFDDACQASLARLSRTVPVVWAPNMSRGVQVLAEVVKYAVERLGIDFDVEIVEVHHRRKVDSPSGTAVRLAQAAHEARPELFQVRGRDGEVGARKSEEMAVFGVRGGDVIGDHTVHLLGDSERLELTHRATNRDVFARGAISAARFVVGKPPGIYTISDVLHSAR
jgi:4-hydroxy-tetrahydrodipicolinate reductase